MIIPTIGTELTAPAAQADSWPGSQLKVLVIHNAYAVRSGEEVVVDGVAELLQRNGCGVEMLVSSSESIQGRHMGAMKAFFSGIHSPSSCRRMRDVLWRFRPDLVNVHNVYPLISPSVLKVCRNEGVPVVMTVHNYRLICPSGLFMTRGQVCHRCAGGREHWCVLRNCEGSLSKSIGYALRNWAARKRRAFLDNVTMYMALTHFQRDLLVREGFPADRIEVVPNAADGDGVVPVEDLGAHVGFVGRVSAEKGIATLRAAAEMMPQVSFQAAGGFDPASPLVLGGPENLAFRGQMDRSRLREFYGASRIIVLPSVWYEGFPMVLVEAMLHGKPVICSRIGGLPEIVDDGVTGLLFEPGKAEDLAEKVRYLWDRPDLCRQMGGAGREKALREYSRARYYERMLGVFDQAVRIGPGGPARSEGTNA